MGTFEVMLSDGGEPVSLRRSGRHRRCQTDQGAG
jgi:hypothetical protein